MAKSKDIKIQKLYSQIDEMRDMISSLLEDQKIAYTELHYLSGFISYKKLDEEYGYFRKNAHEEHKEDLPFPYLTL